MAPWLRQHRTPLVATVVGILAFLAGMAVAVAVDPDPSTAIDVVVESEPMNLLLHENHNWTFTIGPADGSLSLGVPMLTAGVVVACLVPDSQWGNFTLGLPASGAQCAQFHQAGALEGLREAGQYRAYLVCFENGPCNASLRVTFAAGMPT